MQIDIKLKSIYKLMHLYLLITVKSCFSYLCLRLCQSLLFLYCSTINLPFLICPFFFSCGSWNTWWNLNRTFAILHGHAIFDFGILFLVCGPSCLFGNPKSSVQKQSNLANNFSGWREKVSKNVIVMINYNLLL